MRQTVFCILFAAATSVANAQHDMSGPRPTSPGNAAFGTIKEIVDVAMPHPRDRSSTAFVALEREIKRLVREEVAKLGVT